MERIPITRVKQLEDLDEAEMAEGYIDGFSGFPEAGENRSYSYWHGWRNGKADKTGNLDNAQRELARDYVQNQSKEVL